jgi:hypothetical protein
LNSETWEIRFTILCCQRIVVSDRLRNHAYYAHFGENHLHSLHKIKLRQIESTLKKIKNRSTFPMSTRALMISSDSLSCRIPIKFCHVHRQIVRRDVNYRIYRSFICRSNAVLHECVAQKLRGIESPSSAQNGHPQIYMPITPIKILLNSV